MKKPYIKKWGEVAGFKIYIVDGKYVRANLDEQFPNFAQHYVFNFIPKDEFWIDKEYHKRDETGYYIDHLLVENRLMSQGYKYYSALVKADLIEKAERAKSILVKKIGKKILPSVHIHLLKKYSGLVSVWLVNGELVRDKYFVDFNQGGHHFVYHFIPKYEIWIDDTSDPKELKFILLHELYERNLMIKALNKKNSDKLHKVYLKAHYAASDIEYFYRRHPKKLDEKLRVEIKKANKN